MADQGPLVRVDRGNGSGFKLARQDAEAFVAANPGAFIVDEAKRPKYKTPLAQMSMAELAIEAGRLGIALGGKATKDDLIAAIEGAPDGVALAAHIVTTSRTARPNEGDAVRVDSGRGDGSGMKLTRAEAEKYVAANPGAFIVGEPRVVAEGVIGEEKALGDMTRAELDAHAEAHGIDVSGAKTKADVIAAIEAAGSDAGDGDSGGAAA